MENNETLTFESLPSEVASMSKKIDILISIVAPSLNETEKDRKLSLEDLQEYLPDNPAKQTIYGWVNDRKIPFEKHGRRLYFSKLSINNWLKNGRQMP